MSSPVRRLVVVGLGPGGPGLVTAASLERLRAAHDAGRLWLRTSRHPAASLVPDAPSFDQVYEQAGRLDEVYPAIVERLLELVDDGGGAVTYAVPGSPVVAERTVELLVARAAAEADLDVEIVPALSFLDLAWARLGIDPVAAGVRVVDGQRFDVEAAGQRGPLLVAQCDSAAVLSGVKLALDEGLTPALAPEARVIVLQGLGTDDERMFEVAGVDLDRVVTPDHLTSLYLPELAAPVAGEVARLVELVATLRVECPWDRKQTHQSLRRHLLEESYEVLEAIDELDIDELDLPASPDGLVHLEEELGDLLFQIAFHSRLATEEGGFTLADVARGVHDKLVARHPHVFGDVTADTADEVVANWEQIKKVEKGRDSVFDGVPAALPALLYAAKVQKKAVSIDLDPGAGGDGRTEPAASAGALDDAEFADRLGEVLWSVVDRARRLGVDPEDALRAATVAHLADLRAAEAGRDSTT
jgi:tetrapyrrole methylase family protein / MazG family protein